jgi:alpha-tubulin suppressor-like RCC1 family protein
LAALALLLIGMPATASGASTGLYAFGSNVFGQLGSTATGSTTPNPTPTLVALPGATGPVIKVAGGATHSLAVTSTGQLYAFGENFYGQLGNSHNNNSSNPNPTPALVALAGATGPVTQVAAGDDYSLAATSTGQLYAFGENSYGQLGSTTNNTTFKPNPTPTLVTLPGATGTVTQLSANGLHSLVLTSTGQLYAFGNNGAGELGNPTGINNFINANPVPKLVGLSGATGQVIRIAAGESHSMALTSSGQVYTFGGNGRGQLGRTQNTMANPTPTVVAFPGATGPVTQIAAGSQHSLALTSTGQLYAFGSNFDGQLGNAQNTGMSTAHPTPTLVSLSGVSGSIAQIAAGKTHTIVVTSTGQAFAFGDNSFGQLGTTINSGTGAANPTPLRVALPAGLIPASVGIGEGADHTLMVLTTPPAQPPPKVPALSVLHISPGSMSLGGRKVKGHCVKPTKKNRKHKHCQLPIALKLSYKLNIAATVQFTVTRQDPGRKVKGRCVKPTKKNRKNKHCTRVATVGSITVRSTAGSNAFTFNGGVGGKTLGTGSYQITATPRANGKVGTPRTVSFALTK